MRIKIQYNHNYCFIRDLYADEDNENENEEMLNTDDEPSVRLDNFHFKYVLCWEFLSLFLYLEWSGLDIFSITQLYI